MAKYTAMEIANYIVGKCSKDKCTVTNLQLQKILYFLQREYLHNNGTPLFDDDIEAWQFGPVIPEVYYRFCAFGAMPISSREIVIDPIIEDKLSKYPWDLVEETHQPGGAWDLIYEDGIGNRDVIPINLIEEMG